MENKILFLIKSFFGTIGTIWSFVVGAMGWAFPTLVIMMAADFISGVTAGSLNGGVSSAVGRKGFVKKVHILIIVGMVYLLESGLYGTQHIGDGATIAYIVIEFISLTENAGKLGVPLGPIKSFITVLREKTNGKG
jgi:toxin secretion/phage lysis holin